MCMTGFDEPFLLVLRGCGVRFGGCGLAAALALFWERPDSAPSDVSPAAVAVPAAHRPIAAKYCQFLVWKRIISVIVRQNCRIPADSNFDTDVVAVFFLSTGTLSNKITS